MIDRDVYLDRVRALFDDYHRRTPGSVDRSSAADDVLAGWSSPPPANVAYKGAHGLRRGVPSWEAPKGA